MSLTDLDVITRDQATGLQPREQTTTPFDLNEWVNTTLKPYIDDIFALRHVTGSFQIRSGGYVELWRHAKSVRLRCVDCNLSGLLHGLYTPTYRVETELDDGHRWWKDLPRWASQPPATLLQHPVRIMTITPARRFRLL